MDAMSAHNVDVIRRLLGAFNRGDFGALNELAADVELQDEPRIPGAGWNYGHQGAVEWAVKLWQVFGEFCLTIDEPMGAGEYVAVRWRAQGKGKRSGVEVDTSGYAVFTIKDRKVRRLVFFDSRRAALEAAGLTKASSPLNVRQ
jgi:hypothetical protein